MQQSSPIEHPVRRCPVREEEDELLRLGWRNCQRGRVDGKARRDFITHLLGQDQRTGATDGDHQSTT
jgi:hypothetical protein